MTAFSGTQPSTGNFPGFAALDPTGTYLYVPNENDNSISVFTIGAGGALTPKQTFSRAVSGALYPRCLPERQQRAWNQNLNSKQKGVAQSHRFSILITQLSRLRFTVAETLLSVPF